MGMNWTETELMKQLTFRFCEGETMHRRTWGRRMHVDPTVTVQPTMATGNPQPHIIEGMCTAGIPKCYTCAECTGVDPLYSLWPQVCCAAYAWSVARLLWAASPQVGEAFTIMLECTPQHVLPPMYWFQHVVSMLFVIVSLWRQEASHHGKTFM